MGRWSVVQQGLSHHCLFHRTVMVPVAYRGFHTTVFFTAQSWCLLHTGKPTGVAISHCTTQFQTQLPPGALIGPVKS